MMHCRKRMIEGGDGRTGAAEGRRSCGPPVRAHPGPQEDPPRGTLVMAQMQSKSFARADEVRRFDKGMLELVTLGGVTFGRGAFQPGWRWSTSVKPLAKTPSCAVPHL